MRGRHRKAVVIQVYTPDTNHDDEEVEGFYSQLEEELERTHEGDLVIVMGDFNSKTGSDNQGYEELAAERDHAHLLPCLLGAGLSVEGSGTDDQTPLMRAATNNHTTTVKNLLSLGADPLAVDNGGWTALHWAAVDGEAECVSTLIQVTPPTPELLQAADGHTPVHLASFGGHEAVLKALEGAGWPLYATDGDGLTPLHWAVKAGRLNVVRYLLDKDAAPSTGAGDDLTPLDLAKRQGKDLAARWLARRSGAVHGDAAHSLNPEVTSSARVNAAAGDDTLRPEDVRKLLGFREWLIDRFNEKILEALSFLQQLPIQPHIHSATISIP
ncbi:ankyrin-3-like [Eriocheir sinensis]|uniref:ankyrin-3-like n=1 Tax=Eriocheir sinensis TaxID=95602 RepID=UPI0021C5793B|nr:ankyrin-3-like [Eriocheir sinensis]